MTPRVEPPPKKGTAQKLLYSLQQMSYILLGEKPIDVLVKSASMEEGVKVPGGSTPNFKRMGRFGSMVYYHLIDDKENYNKYRTQTLNFLRDERVTGHMGIEQGCNQPHDGMHLSATMLAHLLAVKTNDTELVSETEWWIASYLAICKACYHPSYNRVVIPGFRCKTSPVSDNRDVIFQHLVLDRKIKDIDIGDGNNGWRVKDKYLWQRYYLPIKLAIELKKMVRNPLPALKLPKLYAPMDIRYWSTGNKSGLIAKIEVPKSPKKLNISNSEIVDKIEIDNGMVLYTRLDGIGNSNIIEV